MDILAYYHEFPLGKPLSIFARLQTQSPTKSKNKVPNLAKTNPPQSSFHFVAYCLMPNHYHFLIRQVKPPTTTKTSITNFMRRFSITYSMYFNEKYKHSGNLLQGKYKNVVVTSENQFLHLTKYIHLNPNKILNNRQKLKDYPYSSYSSYLSKTSTPWLSNQAILSYFSEKNPNLSYQSFVEEQPVDSDLINQVTLE